DEIQLVHDKILVVNRTVATWEGRVVGSVITLRDRTDLQSVSGELDSVRSLADSLRAQNHEAANRLQTVVSLIELGRAEAAVEFATSELELAQRLTDEVVAAVDDPVLAAMLLGKTAQAAERGIELTVVDGSAVGEHGFDPQDLVTLVGNLLDNAMDATGEVERDRRVEVYCELADDRLRVRVGDSGPGLAVEQRSQVFTRGWSTKPGADGIGRGIGLALVTEVVRRLGGRIEIGESRLGGAEFTVAIPAEEDLIETRTTRVASRRGEQS
ncbi:MAG TPA: ATP-binding protein, partial [Microlunatus sp.]